MSDPEKTNRYPDIVNNRRMDQDPPARSWKVRKENAELVLNACKFVQDHILICPFTSVRRQCQVHANPRRYHLSPFTVGGLMISLYGSVDSFSELGRGMTSYFVFQISELALEKVVVELIPFLPRMLGVSSIYDVAGHLALKAVCFGLSSPLFIVHIIDSIRSKSNNQENGLLELLSLLRDTFDRCLAITPSCRQIYSQDKFQVVRPYPYWKNIPLVTGFLLSNYVITSVSYHLLCRPLVRSLIVEEQQRGFVGGKYREAARRTADHEVDENRMFWRPQYADMVAGCLASSLTTLVTLPFETVVCNMIAQGTRTIIDDTDLGTGVLPVSTAYESGSHCASNIVDREGLLGLFKGLGSLVLQVGLQMAFSKVSALCVEHWLNVMP